MKKKLRRKLREQNQQKQETLPQEPAAPSEETVASPATPDFEQLLRFYFPILFVALFAFHIYASLVGWHHTLLDGHGFRQTQTAMTAFYFIKEGFRLDYITPVLGKPWSIPMEFPIFQGLVACLVLVTKMGLDQAGRLLSLIFFYLSLVPMFFLTGLFVEKKEHRFVIPCLVLASPIYLFWSRTFMIESLAVCLSLFYLWLFTRLCKNPKPVLVALTAVTGILAALTKITTFGVVLPPSLVLFYVLRRREGKPWSWDVAMLKQWIPVAFFIYGVPILATLSWIHFADAQKALNPLAAEFITSKALGNWNYGTLAQKFSTDTWAQVLETRYWIALGLRPDILVAVHFAFLGICLATLKKYRVPAILCFLFFLVGPFTFINLYLVHDYYWYANSYLLIACVGFVLLSCVETPVLKLFTQLVLFPVVLGIMINGYYQYYYPVQSRNFTQLDMMSKVIQETTDEDGVLLVYGLDWSSELPYYAQRKAMMIIERYRKHRPEEVKRSLENLGKDKIQAVVIAGELSLDQAFLEKTKKEFNLESSPVLSLHADLYLVKK